MKVILLLLLMRTGVGERCGVDTSIDITEGEHFENGTIEYNGTRYTPDLYYEASDNKTRGCICRIVNCYRKCCGRAEIYHEGTGSCLDRSAVNVTRTQNETMYEYFEEFEKLEEEHGLRQVNGYNELNVCDDESSLFRTDAIKSHKLTKAGALVIENVEGPYQEVDVDRYCIDIMLYVNEKTGETTLGREAYFCVKVHQEAKKYPQNYIAMLISIVFMLLTIAVLLILPDMKKSLHRRNLLCHLCSMLVSFVWIVAMQTSPTFINPTRKLCMIFSFIIYFSLLATFFWLNVMCFDMWRKFRFTRINVSGDVERRFRRYCVYAFGLPLLLTVLVAALEYSPIEDHYLLPRMRKRKCFLSGKGLLIYLYIPITIVCITNIVLFVLITIHIVATNKNSKKDLGNEDSRISKAINKQRLLTYIKLFIAMGITWILEVVSFLFPEADLLWRISDVFNALNGLFIFIIVVCNKEKLMSLKNRFEDIFNIRNIKSSTITVNSCISQNLIKDFENTMHDRKSQKNSNEEMRTSETKENPNTNDADENDTLITQINDANKCFNEENSDLSKGDKTKENTVRKVDRDSIMIDEIVSENTSDK